MDKGIRRRILLSAVMALAGVLVTPVASAAPGSAEDQYLTELYQYVHPSVTAPRLVQLGNLACSVRRRGGTSYDARDAVWQNLDASGVVSSNAEMGTLVHAAVDQLCPEVGYP